MVVTKNWETGGGAVTITYDGDGDGTISVSSDVNSGAPRQMVLAVSNDYGQSVDLTVKQEGIYDAEVEYLETDSSGVCYIQTDYVPSGANISYETKFRWISWGGSSNTYITLYAARTSSSTQGFMAWRYGSSTRQIQIYCGQRGWANSGIKKSLTSGKDVVLHADVNSIDFNGTVSTYSEGAYSSANKKALRLWHNSIPISLRYYYFKMWDDGVLKLDLIPVRVGNVGYMYDRVTGNLYGNSGSGNFIIGPDL